MYEAACPNAEWTGYMCIAHVSIVRTTRSEDNNLRLYPRSRERRRSCRSRGEPDGNSSTLFVIFVYETRQILLRQPARLRLSVFRWIIYLNQRNVPHRVTPGRWVIATLFYSIPRCFDCDLISPGFRKWNGNDQLLLTCNVRSFVYREERNFY